MNYIYENLGDELFQVLCQNLINQEFPNIQAFPIGQPDGGRDAIVYEMTTSTKDFIVFQIKYVKAPDKIEDVHKWLVKIAEKEAPKIKKLIPKGAKAYYLLTNVQGTGHLDVGSIDLLNRILEKYIQIPALCWWRDDLNGKLDSRVDLKWSYPQILNGQDLFNSVLFSQVKQDGERRKNVIRAYLADQYQIENEVKFKQIELENRLFDLFVDVPLEIKDFSSLKSKRNIHIYHELQYRYTHYRNSHDMNAKVGAAFFLLNSEVQKNFDRLLLEGGPGQGKSTITQFVCQIHRANLLSKKAELDGIPDVYKNTALRLPIKIDLRDLASWISGKNPYASNISENWFNGNYKNSLESFLIAHIFYHSNIEDFNFNDLISTCKDVPLLIVFDGFDEIADLDIREKIIDTINNGVKRINENIKQLQIIITSRPAAFANSAKFSNNQYPHFQLSDIDNSVINEYLEKWIKGKNLMPREGNAIRKIVQNKLELPHLRDLAKSPMQLAILLSLINTRGESLPNKRTELYDSYIDLFFNRESEKNEVVRNKRDLLINIHRYLAWVLHFEAELYNNNGRIDVESLKNKLKDYLIKEGHPTEIADQLFTVMEERVCAIVSRVQGTFEFEVQPLREYFCAKYLYDTSPYAPVGRVIQGTLPDRFDALVRNFYWQNVTRFFAGCFDRGELPMLIDKLNEINESKELKYTNYIRSITSELLSDFVFSQYPKLLKEVIKIITSGINIGSLLDINSHFGGDSLSLPLDCGREELVNECFQAIELFPNRDYANELILIIQENDVNNVKKWKDIAQKFTLNSLNRWLAFGRQMQVLYRLDENDLIKIVEKDGPIGNFRLKILLDSNRWGIIDKNLEWKTKTLMGILNMEISSNIWQPKQFSLSGVLVLYNALLLKSIFNYNANELVHTTFSKFMVRRHFRRVYEENFNFDVEHPKDKLDETLKNYYSEIRHILSSEITTWYSSIEKWSTLINTGEKFFGNQWIFKVCSVIASAIKSTDDSFSYITNLHSEDYPLCHRTRAARLRSGQVSWWKNELETSSDKQFSLLTLFTWCTSKTILEIASEIDQALSSLSAEEFDRLHNAYKKTSDLSFFNLAQQKQIIESKSLRSLSNNFLYFLCLRFPPSIRNKVIKEFFVYYIGENDIINTVKLDYSLREFIEKGGDEESLKNLKHLYGKLRNYRYSFSYESSKKTFSLDLAKIVMTNCKKYPKALVLAAENSCRQQASKESIAIGKVAIEQKWFEN